MQAGINGSSGRAIPPNVDIAIGPMEFDGPFIRVSYLWVAREFIHKVPYERYLRECNSPRVFA